MPQPSAAKFPVFYRNCTPASEAIDSGRIDGWLEEAGFKRKSQICDAFREAGGRDWVSQIVTLWKLDDLPLASLADQLGISDSQASRLRNHCSTSIGVLGQWAAQHDLSLPAPDFHRWSVIGIAYSLSRTMWLAQVADARPNRTPLPVPINEHEVYLLLTLLAGGLQVKWDDLTCRYEADLYQAKDDAAFETFVTGFTRFYLRLTQVQPGAKRRYPIYFSEGHLITASRWELCRDIDALMRKIEYSGERMWRAVDGLTPWLGGLAARKDELA
jgi:hypothetical protein